MSRLLATYKVPTLVRSHGGYLANEQTYELQKPTVNTWSLGT
jgi:hypothetical protein